MRYTELNDWLTWQEKLHSSEIDMGLERVRTVAERMQLLTPDAQVVSVAGTNGKGSCVATLEALCVAQGVSVGAFTSPHLQRYNERIRVGGQTVTDQQICESFERIDQARGDISLTYFEFGTLAAIDIFHQQQVDVMLLEVGLGGRLDAVNIVDADVSIVTSIALDHEEWLGSDINVIGFEKAGIYRPHRWAICADEQAPSSVADYAHDIGAYWVAMGMSLNMTLDPVHKRWSWQGVTEEGGLLQRENLPLPKLPLPSVAAALQGFVLLGKPLPEHLSSLLENLTLSGRAQRVQHGGTHFLLDVAHNPAAAEMLAERLVGETCDGETHCIVAMMADKDRAGVFLALKPLISEWHVAGLPDNSRAASAAQLAQDLEQLGCPSTVHVNVPEAIAYLKGRVAQNDRVVIMGSFFTVAEALSVFGCDA
ncbi:bifunctional tetrahydrofolate synthase/dihydrofolate synthase [Aestuariicella hydrocarbonica]|uniref:Dihydrofolate synthase/folylpolyglutamate synthase n=1 Tax=Pseudomaricurvus hydrocarbonicus TaxID=1470433 RepID=A0A9E5MLF2_9GAMM|nr:bifunctional tetrahydrofolate synthase/dihydrofolate synthase [Aestuariicella hydrocarbonica]NHO64388.1 bifunctional tetrahydrofolate synthase/dihydrofolate synthase [Aestuariicella hydrocarbonica]